MSSTPLQALPDDSGRGGNAPRNSRPARSVDPSNANGLYPLLLLLSTSLAAVFCYLYLTKPVIIQQEPFQSTQPALVADLGEEIAPEPAAGTTPAVAPDSLALLPNAHSLPGDAPSGAPATTSPLDSRGAPSSGSGIGLAYEETNLKVQHVMTAQANGVDLGKIILDVPVLYETRRLRWTPNDIQEARAVLIRLSAYQDKLRNLKAEGSFLLDSWNNIMARTIPTQAVRADSPSIPENQGETPSSSSTGPADEALMLQPKPAVR